jgi:hypothetical protein
VDADFERDASPGARLGEDHCPSLAGQGFLVTAALLLEMAGHGENLHDLVA